MSQRTKKSDNTDYSKQRVYMASQYIGNDTENAGPRHYVSEEILKVWQEITSYQMPTPGGQREAVLSFGDDLDACDFLLPTKATSIVEGKLPVGDGFGALCERDLKPAYTVPKREGPSHSLRQSKQFRNALAFPGAASARAVAKSKDRNHELSENLPAKTIYDGKVITVW